jgi:hypothetical protein
MYVFAIRQNIFEYGSSHQGVWMVPYTCFDDHVQSKLKITANLHRIESPLFVMIILMKRRRRNG